MKIIFIVLLSLSPFAFANECEQDLQSLVETDSNSQEKVREFLNLQASITMHKLALAGLAKKETAQNFKLEEVILELLSKMDNQATGDKEFIRVKKQFEQNRLSRKALADILPHIKDILNAQDHENSSFDREKFNINMNDIKMLQILAEKEKNFDARQFKTRSKDQSILNFTKIINSSFQSTSLPLSDMRKRMSEKVTQMNLKALKLIESLSSTCYEHAISCSAKNNQQVILSSDTTHDILLALDSLTKPNKHKSLRFGDVWLYTSKGEVSKVRSSRYKKPIQRPDSGQVDLFIHKHLVDKVLRAVPQLFSRVELMNNREFTQAIAQAIDRGIVTAKGDERYFNYNGNKYYFPETILGVDLRTNEQKSKRKKEINSYLYSQIGSLKYSSTASRKIPTSFGPKKIKVTQFSGHEKEAFLSARNRQFTNKGNRGSFFYKGNLYSMKTGKKLKRKISSFLEEFDKGAVTNRKDTLDVFNQDLESKQNIIQDIKRSNNITLIAGELYYTSGAKVELKRDLRKAQIYFNAASKDKNNKEELPSLSKVKVILKTKSKKKNKNNYLKTILNGKRVYKEDKLFINARTNKIIESDIPSQPERFLARMNNESIYFVGKSEFDTLAARKRNGRKPSGFRSHEVELSLENEINSMKNEDKIIAFHKNYPQTCDEYSILDKKRSLLKVYNNSGDLLYSEEALIGRSHSDDKNFYKVYNDRERKTANRTEAGKFSFGEYHKKTSGSSYIEVSGALGGISGISRNDLHRYQLLNDNNLENNRETAGGIVLHPRSLKKYLPFAKKDCPYYVLPENNNFFVLREGSLFYNRIKTSKVAKAISIRVDPSFNINAKTQEYIKSLERQKQKIMKDTGLSNRDYNELAKVAIGILGVESKFGKKDLFDGWFDTNRYGLKNSWLGGLVVFTGKALKRGELDWDGSSRSRGLTQIKSVDEYMKNSSYSYINKKSVKKPKEAAIATMFVLADKLKQLKKYKSRSDILTDSNQYDYLYYLYMGLSKKVRTGDATPDYNPRVRAVNEITDKVFIDIKD